MPNWNIDLLYFTESPLAVERERRLMMVILSTMPTLFSTQRVPRPLLLQGGAERERLDLLEEEVVQGRRWSLLWERVLLGHLWQLPSSSFARTYWDSLAHRYSSMSLMFTHTIDIILLLQYTHSNIYVC